LDDTAHIPSSFRFEVSWVQGRGRPGPNVG